MRVCHFGVFGGILLLLLGCGGTQSHIGFDWQPGELRFFDDGVDMIREPSKLSGKWAYAQDDELSGRVQLADMIAEVEIVANQTSTDNEGVETKRISVQVIEEMYGSAPEKRMALESSVHSPGYNLIKRYEKHLMGRFIVFVRFFRDADNKIAHHFHLSPASAEILQLVGKKIKDRKAEEGREKAK